MSEKVGTDLPDDAIEAAARAMRAHIGAFDEPTDVSRELVRVAIHAYQAHMVSAAEMSWRCFHCGEVFTRESCARAHFGADETYEPACQIAARDGGLVRALREAEASALEAHQQAHDESGDALKAWRAAVGRYEQRIIDAEQAGYDKGVADMRKDVARAQSVSDALRERLDAQTDEIRRLREAAA